MDVVQFIKKAVEKTGFDRIRYQEKNLPTSIDNICIMLLLGDLRTTVTVSSILLKRFREEVKGSKYFILCSWAGFESLFPYVDEYWAVKDRSVYKSVYHASNGIHNNSPQVDGLFRGLNQHFEDVLGEDSLSAYYDFGIKQSYFDRFKHIKRTLPAVSSLGIVGSKMAKDMSVLRPKIFIHPSTKGQRYNKNFEFFTIPKEFWIDLVNYLAKMDFLPIVYDNSLSYNISGDVEKCVYFSNEDVAKTLAVMRTSDCVLDIYSGLSKLAIVARTPFLSIEDRFRYFHAKDYEFDDLCGKDLPKSYVFSFPAIIEKGSKNDWEQNVFLTVHNKLLEFLAGVDRNNLPATSEITEIVPYSVVRKRNIKNLGVKFIR